MSVSSHIKLSARVFVVCLVFCAAHSCGSVKPAFASQINFERLADAIHITENGHSLDRGEQYGIHAVHYSSEAEARAICIRTIKHKYRDWMKNGSHGDFLKYLSTKYCPVNHAVWLKNVRYFYAA